VAVGADDALLWDAGNLHHATRHGVGRAELDAMYEAGRWVWRADPLGRAGQERVTGEVPDSGRLVTVATEWRETPAGRRRRPISSWVARPHEAAYWLEEFGDA
jgi:hypothetical protein